MVNLTLWVLSRPDEAKLPVIYKELGLEYDEKVLPSIDNEILKSFVAQFNADQLLTERGVRVFGFVFCLILFSVMAADRRKGWALNSSDRYCLTVNVIGFVYSALHRLNLAYQLSSGKSKAYELYKVGKRTTDIML